MGVDFFDGGSQALISRHGRDKEEKRTLSFKLRDWHSLLLVQSLFFQTEGSWNLGISYQALSRPSKNRWGILCLWNSTVVPKPILKQSWPPVGFSFDLEPGISYLATCWLSMHSYGHTVGSTWEANQACKGLYPHCKMVTMIGPALSQV